MREFARFIRILAGFIRELAGLAGYRSDEPKYMHPASFFACLILLDELHWLHESLCV